MEKKIAELNSKITTEYGESDSNRTTPNLKSYSFVNLDVSEKTHLYKEVILKDEIELN